MVEEHVDGVVDEPDPSVAAGIVGDLLVGQARAERREQVDSAFIGDAAALELLAEAAEARLRDCERLW